MRAYTVSFDSKYSNQWYAHMVGYPWIPVLGSFGSKKHAMTVAAGNMGLTYDQFVEWRKKHRG